MNDTNCRNCHEDSDLENGLCFHCRPIESKLRVASQVMYDQKIHALLVDEEMARWELLPTIESLIECKVPQELFVETVEQLLLVFKNYMGGVKELSDLLKQTKQESLTSQIASSFARSFNKAPDTERSRK